MNEFVARLRKRTLRSLRAIEGKYAANEDKARKAIPLLEDALEQLRIFMYDYDFKDRQQEIDFFRTHKPSLLRYLLYYRQMYTIETNRPKGGSIIHRQYLLKEQGQISAFLFRHREFYRYYRSGDSHFDNYYFVGNKPGKSMSVDNFYYRSGAKLFNSGDYLAAHVMAYDMLSTFVEMEIGKLEKTRYVFR